MISNLIKKIRLAICTLGIATPGKEPTPKTENISKPIVSYEDFSLGSLVHVNSSIPTDRIPGFNMTREFRRNLLKEMKLAQQIKEHIIRAKEHYALCRHKFGYKLSKTVEFLDTYYKHMNDTYNAIYNIVHGQLNQISKRDLAVALRGMNETLKKQAWEELSKFPIYPDRRLPG